MNISTFTLDGEEISLTFTNGFLAYSFMYKGDTYGIKTKLKTRKVMDVAAATFLLLTNASDTLKSLKEDDK